LFSTALGGDRRSQIQKMDIGVARFHRLGLITLALIGASCHPSPTLGTQTKKLKKWFYKQLLLKLPQPKKQIRNQI
jgi:hypothetical protein